MTTLALSAQKPAVATADALVVGIAPSPDRRRRGAVPVGPAAALPAPARRRLQEGLDALGAAGKPGEVHRLAGAGIAKAPLILAVGLGDPDRLDEETLRRAAGNAARALAGTRRAAFALPAPSAAHLGAVATGAVLGGYDFAAYRAASLADHKAGLRAASLLVDDARDTDLRAALARAEVVAGAVTFARDLINTPPLDLPPAALADRAVAAAEGIADLTTQVLDDDDLRAGGYGGLIGVGQGSHRPPRLVRLAYRPDGAVAHLALVGKGITFDTGGISIKPALNMHAMKSDMSGAAAVVAAAVAIARLRIPVAVTAYAACAENMPGGGAQRPGDVITIYGGRTVEVLDTDAEGRLVLSDALVRAQEDRPDVLLDVATLTGAQVIALGGRTYGIMANDDGLLHAVHDAAGRAGETSWPMPIPEEMLGHLASTTADIANIPTVARREGGMLSAGAFLRSFVADGTRWAHLDIAGPAFHEGAPYGYVVKGGTGVAVRTFVQVAEDLAAGTIPAS